MSIKAIVYSSKTGHTLRYAEALASRLELPLYDVKQAQKTLNKRDEVIFLGWILAGKIQGYERTWTSFEVKCLCSVGLYPDSQKFREYMGRNNIIIDTEYFHLRGGIDTAALKGAEKFTMKFLMNAISKKVKSGKAVTDEEQQMLSAYEASSDFVDLNALDAVVQWYQGQE